MLCVPPTCGNGVLDPLEQCDDGNNIGGDGCPADCSATCGDGVVDPGEVCDDGNTTSGDGCSQDCQIIEKCGNGHLDPNEQCDDGNLRDHDGCSGRCTIESPLWVTPDTSPPPRAGAAIAYDALHGQIVMFGGCTYDRNQLACTDAPRGDTWVFDGERWIDKTTPVGPGARAFAAMAFDAAHGRIVMFGGCGDAMCGAPVDDTWEWDGERWTATAQMTRPTPRAMHAMAYDGARQRVVLFGGWQNIEPEPYQDTWEWDGTAWTEASPATMPPGRMAHAMAFDPARGKLVLFGGEGPGALFTDTWEWDGVDWTARTPTASPPPRIGGALVYDPVRHAIVALAGCELTFPICFPGDVAPTGWIWDGTTWAALPADARPPARLHAAIAYDTARDAIVAFGGADGDLETRGETFVWTDAWRERGLPARPLPRNGVAAVYDSRRGATIAFGGNQFAPLGDTWELSDATWFQRSPMMSPPARREHAMAYDRANGVVVLFGGNDTNGVKNDTWLWDGDNWSLAPAPGPDARSGHAMAYDETRGKVVLFGGCPDRPFACASASYFADTWEWDGSTWTLRSPATSPPGRTGHAMAFDPMRGKVVLFGGLHDGSSLADAWEWDGNNWSPVAGGPPARGNHAMTYDRVRGVVVMSGGCTSYPSDNIACNTDELADVWSWDGATWSALPAMPRPRAAHAMAFDERAGTIVTIAGESTVARQFQLLDDTWALGPAGWSEIARGAPSPRLGAMTTYDVMRGRVVVFGGGDGINSDGDTWEWDGGWIQRHPADAPSPRRDGALAYDAARGVSVLFGGSTGGDETWTWNGTTWTQATPASSPPPRTRHAMAYDAVRRKVVLFGGSSTGASLGDTWEWDGITWTQATPAASPPARDGHGMVYDGAHQRVVLYGGNPDDLWAWDGTTWSSLPATDKPPQRSDFGMTYMPDRASIIVFGGRGRTGALADSWEWNGTTWTQLDTAVSPSARSGVALVYDAVHQRSTLVGGLVDDTWFFEFADVSHPEESCPTGFDGNGNGVSGCADASCEGDCDPLCASFGACDAGRPICGDHTCGPLEDCRLCPGDCGACHVCGDQHCDPGETCADCPGDCGACP
jgi:cysteine-rich repeat protein